MLRFYQDFTTDCSFTITPKFFDKCNQFLTSHKNFFLPLIHRKLQSFNCNIISFVEHCSDQTHSKTVASLLMSLFKRFHTDLAASKLTMILHWSGLILFIHTFINCYSNIVILIQLDVITCTDLSYCKSKHRTHMNVNISSYSPQLHTGEP